MAMRISNLSKSALCLALGMMWGAASAGDMMKDEGMSGDGKMMEHDDASMGMDKSDMMKGEEGMKTMEGDMKAMEAEMPMDAMEHDKGKPMKDGM